MSAVRLTGARKYDLIPLVLHVLAVSGVFKGGYWAMPHSAKKKSVLNKRKKIGKYGLPSLFIHLNHSSKHSNVDLILVDSSCRK